MNKLPTYYHPGSYFTNRNRLLQSLPPSLVKTGNRGALLPLSRNRTSEVVDRILGRLLVTGHFYIPYLFTYSLTPLLTCYRFRPHFKSSVLV